MSTPEICECGGEGEREGEREGGREKGREEGREGRGRCMLFDTTLDNHVNSR